MPPLMERRCLRTPRLGWDEGWWGPAVAPSKAGELHLILLKYLKNRVRKKENARRNNSKYSANKHQRRVEDAIKDGIRHYYENEVIELARKGELELKLNTEGDSDYLLFRLPERAVFHCPVSKLDKLSGAVAVRIDMIRPVTYTPHGPRCMSTRELRKKTAPPLPPQPACFHPARPLGPLQPTHLPPPSAYETPWSPAYHSSLPLSTAYRLSSESAPQRPQPLLPPTHHPSAPPGQYYLFPPVHNPHWRGH
ncbi:hypothetical protein DIPPA_33958 [Diplonema papillatum]|nr:hypothetical protein DIPPA_33958 [Diplonema papillatum]